MTAPDIRPLSAIMEQLRNTQSGCPWDIEQDFVSIAPYTIEEAYEVVDAIERNDMVDLKDELGDLLLQVLFHSQMASEAGHFTLADVIDGICEKMIRRHPHVFDSVTSDSADSVATTWEAIKAAERKQKDIDASQLSGIAKTFPALLRAQKIQKRAARVGFDWPDISGAKAKLIEEIDELEQAQTETHRMEEMGDLLFAMVNMARHLSIDAEAALKAGNAKFERRFRAMEAISVTSFADLSLDEKEQLWQQVKKAE